MIKALILDWTDLVIDTYLLTHRPEKGDNVQSTKAVLKDIIQSKAQLVTNSKGQGALSCLKRGRENESHEAK